MSDDWRRTCVTKSRERSSLLAIPGYRPMETIIVGPHKDAQVAEVLAATRCPECLQGYPERPSKRSAKRIVKAAQWNWPSTEEEAVRKMSRGLCPICNTEMSPELAAKLFTGSFDPDAERSADYAQARIDEAAAAAERGYAKPL